MVVYGSVIPVMVGSIKKEGHHPGWPGQKVRPFLQSNQSKRAGEMTQAEHHLPSKHRALNSNLSTTKKI
jgi:hypothetical protein